MKKYILLLFIVFLAWACEKETEFVAVEDSSYLVYNQSLACRPLETDAGFFFIAQKDQINRFMHIDTLGNLSSILDLSPYFAEVSIDSIQNLNIYQLANNNVILAFAYSSVQDDDLNTIVQAVEIRQDGYVVEEFNQAVPMYNNDLYEYLAVSKNVSSQWVVVSSHVEASIDSNVEPELILQTTVYESNGDNISPISSIQSLPKLSVLNTYVDSDNSIEIFLEEESLLPAEQSTNSDGITLISINSDGTTGVKSLDKRLTSVEIVKRVGEELIIVGITSQSVDQSILFIEALDNQNNVSWQRSYTALMNFTPMCIQFTSSGLLMGGLYGELHDLDWGNVYEQISSLQVICAFDSNGEVLWSSIQQTDFQSMIVGVDQLENGYSWLLTKRSFNTYNNMALVKTDFEGNLN